MDKELIKDIRQTLGMTQVVFAAEIGVDQSTVSDWERGELSPRGPALKVLVGLEKKAAKKKARAAVA